MCPDMHLPPSQRGAGLPIALFIITVLALLVASMAQLQQTSAQLTGLQIQKTRALYAAESGAQAALHRLLLLDQTPAAACTTLNFTAPGLTGCSARVTCKAVTVMLDGVSQEVFSLQSEGSCGAAGGPDFARRVIEVGAKQ